MTTLASLDKAGCAHLDALATRSVAVATAEEADAAYRRTRKVSNVLLHDFWGPRGHDATMDSLRAVQAQKAQVKGKGKAPAEGPGMVRGWSSGGPPMIKRCDPPLACSGLNFRTF